MWSAMAQPMHSLVWQSITVARYAQPRHVDMYVMSPTSLTPGAGALKSRATRSGTALASPGVVVVGRNGLGWQGYRPRLRITDRTSSGLQDTCPRTISAWMRR